MDGAAKRVGGSSDGQACDAVAGPARRQRGARIGNASGKGTLTVFQRGRRGGGRCVANSGNAVAP